jgi:hypothetical protein
MMMVMSKSAADKLEAVMGKPEKNRSWYLDLTIALVLVLLGAHGITTNVGVLMRSAESSGSNDWPAVPAVVQSSEMIEAGGWLDDESWRPRITYTYDVAEANYTGNRFSFNNPNQGMYKPEVDLLVSRFTPGDLIEVYVDPEDPNCSTMVTGNDEDTKGGSLLDLILVALGSMMLWNLARHRIMNNPQQKDTDS